MHLKSWFLALVRRFRSGGFIPRFLRPFRPRSAFATIRGCFRRRRHGGAEAASTTGKVEGKRRGVMLTRAQRARRRKSHHALWFAPQMAMLEARVMLTADLSYAGSAAQDLTLAFDSTIQKFQLLDTANNNAVVSQADFSAAANGGVLVTGTIGADVLRLDTSTLALAGSKAITFVGAGDDKIAVTADTNFTLMGSTLVVGSTTFTLTGFERAALTGGDSSNAFRFGTAVAIGSITVDGGGDTDSLFGSDANNVWMLTGKGTGTVGAVSFGGIENLVGGAGDDTYGFANNKVGDVFLDETAGGTDKLDFSLRNAAVLIDLSSTDKQTVDESLISGFTLTLGSGIAIENVVGSAFADTITGNSLDNRITGGGGGDKLAGGAADDYGKGLRVDGFVRIRMSSGSRLRILTNPATRKHLI